MSKHADIGAPAGGHRARFRPTLLLVPLALLTLWAISSPFLHVSTAPATTRVAAKP